jgi:multidrug efflux pump subunit AcrB
MTLALASVIIFLIALSIGRAVLNSRIYNNLHDSQNEMIYSASDATTDEIDKSNQSFLFAIYCVLIFIWFRFKRTDLILVIWSTLLSLITVLILVYAFSIKWKF